MPISDTLFSHPASCTVYLPFFLVIETFAIPALIAVLVLWVTHSLVLNRRLIKNQNRYRQFFSDSPVALIVVNSKHSILEWNQAAETIFGWNEDEAKEKNIIEFIVPNFDRTHVYTVLKKASKDGISYSKNYNSTHHNREIFCEWRNRLLENGDILCMAQDITHSKKMLDELNKRSSALESAGDAIFYTNHKGLIEFANSRFFALALEDQGELYGMHIGKYLFKEALAFNAILSQFDANHTWRGKIEKKSRNGEKVFSVTITALYHRNRLISYIANLHDISYITSHVDDLTYRVQHDPLTGAINRATLYDRLEHAMNRAKRKQEQLAIYFIDLNDFKLVNDTHGHEAGDRLLQSITHNIRSCLRNSDTVCRYGGDEFIIMIEEVKGEDHLHSVYEAIKTAIYEPIIINSGLVLHPRASIGVALYPDDGEESDTLIKAADTAMYIVKRQKSISEPEPKLYADNHNR